MRFTARGIILIKPAQNTTVVMDEKIKIGIKAICTFILLKERSPHPLKEANNNKNETTLLLIIQQLATTNFIFKNPFSLNHKTHQEQQRIYDYLNDYLSRTYSRINIVYPQR